MNGVGIHYSESDAIPRLAAWARSGMNLLVHASDFRLFGRALTADISELRRIG